jgi:hypothetical protein
MRRRSELEFFVVSAWHPSGSPGSTLLLQAAVCRPLGLAHGSFNHKWMSGAHRVDVVYASRCAKKAFQKQHTSSRNDVIQERR